MSFERAFSISLLFITFSMIADNEKAERKEAQRTRITVELNKVFVTFLSFKKGSLECQFYWKWRDYVSARCGKLNEWKKVPEIPHIYPIGYTSFNRHEVRLKGFAKIVFAENCVKCVTIWRAVDVTSGRKWTENRVKYSRSLSRGLRKFEVLRN